MALDDIPPWAIADAIKRWHRGECGEGYCYRWAPAPAELRKLSVEGLLPAQETISRLETVLGALSLDRARDPAPIDFMVQADGANVLPMKIRRV